MKRTIKFTATLLTCCIIFGGTANAMSSTTMSTSTNAAIEAEPSEMEFIKTPKENSVENKEDFEKTETESDAKNPSETAQESHAENPSETVQESHAKNPSETVQESHAENPSETVQESHADPPLRRNRNPILRIPT